MALTSEQIHLYWEHTHPDQYIPSGHHHCAVRCVLHGDKDKACTLYFDHPGGFICHSCGRKGSLIDFEMFRSGCDKRTACKTIEDITGASLSSGDAWEFISEHIYRNIRGIAVAKKLKYRQPNGKKTYVWYRPDNAGRWQKGLTDEKTKEKVTPPLYHLHRVIGCTFLWLVEGEKCADYLTALIPSLWPERQKNGLRIAVTTSPDGAWEVGDPKWNHEHNKYFGGRPLVIFEDNDRPGKTMADYVAHQAYPNTDSVRRIAFPGASEGFDIVDWLEKFDPNERAGQLEELVEHAPLWRPEISNEKASESARENWLVEAVDWVSTASPAIDWLVDGVIQADANGIIAAEPKTGKSLVALALLISMACGMRWLGRAVPRRVRTAYISREDSPLLTKVRIAGFLRGMGLDVDPSGWLWCNTREQLGDFNIDNDEHLRNMAADLKERGVTFTILDVFNRIHKRSENDNTEMAQVVERISQMGREAGCSIGVVHHVSKENGNSGRFFTRIRGASAIHGWTEWSVGLTLENPNALNEGKKLIRRAEFESKAGESAPVSFTVEFGNGNLHLQLVDPMAYSTKQEGRSTFRQ